MILPESGSPDVDAEDSRPALAVVAGEPSAEELAALVAVLTAVTAAPPVVDDPVDAWVDGWAAPWRGIGASVPLGPGAWGAGSGS